MLKYLKKIKERITVDKYYKMSDAQLEKEARKWNIKMYGTSNGLVNRQIIINALLEKDKVNDSRLAIFISIIALIISIIALLK